MRLLLVISFLFTANCFSADNSVLPQGTVKGSLILSPSQVQAFDIALGTPKNCKLKEGGSFIVTKCELDATEVVFANPGTPNARLTFDRSVSLDVQNTSAGELSIQHILRGTWSVENNGNLISLPASITLNTYVGAPGKFSGFLDLGDGTRLFLKARLE